MRFKSIFNRAFHHTSLVVFLAGFIFDIIVLPSDFSEIHARFIGLGHLLVVAFFIYLREWIVSKNTASESERKLFELTTFLISFSSGAALSFVFIYAVRGAEFSVSWPLFLMMIMIIFANELISTHNFRFALDLTVLFVATLFFIIFNTPIFLKEQNDTTFVISLFISAIISLLYVHWLRHSSHTANYEAPRGYALAIGIPLFVGMLYFLNIIPAVPLSLKEAGVYHKVTKEFNGDYIGVKEIDNRSFANFRNQVEHIIPTDDGVYFFSNIDSPADVTAPISHVWEYYDENKKTWVESMTISFDIKGGRVDGYRAYSVKQNINVGLWRVSVKVGDNRIVGRRSFNVVKNNDNIQLEEVKL